MSFSTVCRPGTVLLLFLALASRAEAQTSPDTLSRAAADTLAAADSVRSTFIPALGTISAPDTANLSASRYIWTDSYSLADLLNFRSNFLLRRLGSAGQPDQIAIGGMDWRGAAILIDGRPVNDPVTGIENLYDIPLEFIDHVEIFTGPKSFLYAQNGSGATINIVTRQYNTGRPITKIRFMQGPSEHLLTDALFSQNITRRLNLTFGVQRQVTDGRFFNSAYDAWNVRTRIRYNAAEYLNLSLTDLYQRSVTGMNNGVLIDSTLALKVDPFNEAEAIVSSLIGSQTWTRRDVTLNAIATLFPDSSWTTKAALYYSAAERDYRDSSTSTAFERFTWNVAGATLRQSVKLEALSLDFGGQIESRKASFVVPSLKPQKNYAAWFGHLFVPVIDMIESAGFARGESYAGGRAFSYGASVALKPVDMFELKGSHSQFARFPSLQESAWGSYRTTSSSDINLLEHHTLSDVGVTLRIGASFKTSAMFSRRKITNALLFTPASTLTASAVVIDIIPELSVQQLSGSAEIRLWVFDVAGNLTYTETKNQGVLSNDSPKVVLNGEIAYRDDLLSGALKTRVGVRSHFVSSHNGVRFYPSSMIYAENNGRQLGSFSTTDLFGVFNIGDAFINLTWGNVFDEEYFSVYPYPELGRHIRISVNWIFLD